MNTQIRITKTLPKHLRLSHSQILDFRTQLLDTLLRPVAADDMAEDLRHELQA